MLSLELTLSYIRITRSSHWNRHFNMSVVCDKHLHAEANMIHNEEPSTFYPIGPKLILVTISLMLAVFCVALDNTVLFAAACQTNKMH